MTRTTLATKSKQKMTLLVVVTIFFAVLALLYLNSFLQNHIKSSLTYLILMTILTLASGSSLIALSARPQVLAEYDDDNLYLYLKGGEVVLPWEELESARRKGHRNRIGSVQYADLIFFTTKQKQYVLKDVGDPDQVIMQIQSVLNRQNEEKSEENQS